METRYIHWQALPRVIQEGGKELFNVDVQDTPMFKKQMEANEAEANTAAFVSHFWTERNQSLTRIALCYRNFK